MVKSGAGVTTTAALALFVNPPLGPVTEKL
jgi:hypothetical protein